MYATCICYCVQVTLLRVFYFMLLRVHCYVYFTLCFYVYSWEIALGEGAVGGYPGVECVGDTRGWSVWWIPGGGVCGGYPGVEWEGYPGWSGEDTRGWSGVDTRG